MRPTPALFLGLGLIVSGVAPSPVHAQSPAPAFRLPDVDGAPIALADRRGEVVLLNFWATWCVPCLSELEAFRGLQERHAADGFTVLAVSVDQPQTAARVRTFAKARAFPFPVLLDADEAAYRLYGGAVMPTSVLIDREGRVAWRKEGYQPGDEAEVERRVAALLDSTAKPPGEAATTEKAPDSASVPASVPANRASGFSNISGASLSGSNFLRANYGKETRDQPGDNGWLEDWFDFRIAGGNLSYQLRFRDYQFLRDLPGTRENLVRDPTQRVVKQAVAYEDEHADVRAGNFYGTLNRGLVLRLFEDRQARIDRDAKGAWGALRGGEARDSWGLGRGRISVFGGSTYSRFDDLYAMDAAEDSLRNTWLQGVEGEWEPRAGLTLGAQALEAFRTDRHIKLAAGNVEWLRGGTEAYVGYAGLKGQDAFVYPNDFTGRALYASLSQSFGPLELGAEYKYYYNYDIGFAEPPSLVPYHTFRLTARDMLFPNDQHEEGGQFRGAWLFGNGARYAANVSRIVSHPERNPELLIHHVRLAYLDVDQSVSLRGDDGSALLVGLNGNAQRKFEGGLFEDIRAITVGAVGSRPLAGPAGLWTAGGEAELQRREVAYRSLAAPDPLGGVGPVESRESPWLAVLSATLGRASAGSFTLDYEVTTSARERDPGSVHDRIPGVTNGWASAQLTITALPGHTIALWAGQRKERVICSGGSCRVEPAFEGGELTWFLHF